MSMMIDYKLAKQLKDAGFPYKHFSHIPHFYTEMSYISQNGEDILGVPLLSELIESIDTFYSLNHKRGDWWAEGWANAKNREGLGKSPEEAVARLWLKLNKK